MKTKTLILDFDGTLADTARSITATFRATLQELRLPPCPDEAVRALIGLPLRETFQRAAGIEDDALLDRCADTYRRLFDPIARETASLFPGVAPTLRRLHAEGRTLCIASSRGRASLEWFAARLGIEDCIDRILGEEDVPHKKPAPDMVLRLLEDTRTAPAEALVVGDTTFDIEMGQRALCPTCAVTYGNHTPAQLAAARPTFLIDTFPELLGIL